MLPIRILLFATFQLVLAGCFDSSVTQRAQLPASEAVLAEERKLQVGGVSLQLPVLLLLSSTSNTSLFMKPQHPGSPHGENAPIEALFSDPMFMKGPALEVAYINVDLGSLQSLQDYDTDEHVSTTRICPSLRRQWARNICKSGLIDGSRAFYPRHFTLIDEEYLVTHRPVISAYAGYWLSLGEAANDSIPAPLSENPVPHCQERATGEKNSLCTIVARMGPNLLAVWSTNRPHVEEANEIEEQASRVRCLLARGMQASVDAATTCLD